MHYKQAKGILSSRNSMNIYRGYTHGCIYCDSRSTCYQINHDFEDVEVKENALELLEGSLRRKRKKGMIGTGSMSDPYVHIENTIEYTKQSLEIIYKNSFGVALLTKSTGVLRDLEILKKINERAKVVVQMTLTTFDESLCKILEPNVSSTKERFDALEIFKENGIPTVVWLGPILPYINDTFENIKGIMDYCVKAEVKGIICFGMGLTLREGNREYFYQKLDENFPGIKEKYISEYGNQYSIGSKNNDSLMKYIKKTCKDNNIMIDINEVFSYMQDLPNKNTQLSLFNEVI